MALSVRCPGKPLSTNQIYKKRGIIVRTKKGPRALALLYMSREGKEWKARLAAAAKNSVNNLLVGREEYPRQDAVFVCIDLYFPTRRGDADGPVKPLLDSLQGSAYKNDSQVAGYCVRKFKDKDNPRVDVIVLSMPEYEESIQPPSATRWMEQSKKED